MRKTSRRSFLHSTLAAAASSPFLRASAANNSPSSSAPLDEFAYSQVAFFSDLHEHQRKNTLSVLMDLSEDSMLKPLRAMSGLPAPGKELDGWYLYDPDYDRHKGGDNGFAPACTFGQWVSALARNYAIHPDPAVREKILRLNLLFAQSVSGDFYVNNRFPAYCYDKFVCGLIDSHKYADDPNALSILEHTTNIALPHLPKTAIEHGVSWRPGTGETYTWDESYTISENLFLAYQRGAGTRYKNLGTQYLDDLYYTPLSEGRNNLAGRHAYSHVNSLCSAMQAYLTLGSEMHFLAAKNGFDMLLAQSYATGGWGPDEQLRAPGSDDLFASLSNTHHTFETPCGAYAHFKLTRYLLRITQNPLYGDSMERVMYNTILGAKPLQPDGRTFYYSDYNFNGSKVYKEAHWPCCSGTMPQIAADYRISAYFRDPSGIFINLYLPSTIVWNQDGALVTLKHSTEYPLDSSLRFELQTDKPGTFSIRFRIPAWTTSPALLINGKRSTDPLTPGTFAAVQREWKSGDRIDLELPMRTRLESIDERHSNTAALLYGPLVLFGINAAGRTFSRSELLGAEQATPNSWQVGTAPNPLVLRPFFALASQPYSTYFSLHT